MKYEFEALVAAYVDGAVEADSYDEALDVVHDLLEEDGSHVYSLEVDEGYFEIAKKRIIQDDCMVRS